MAGNCSASLQVLAKAGVPVMEENTPRHVFSIEIGQAIFAAMFLAPNFSH